MERIEIRPAKWKLLLAYAGMAAFVLMGFLIIIYGDGVFEKAAGVLSIVVFGGLGAYAYFFRMHKQARFAILRKGFEIGIPGVTPRIVPWGDVESIGVTKIGKQEFTAIRLRSYQNYLGGITEAEARSALRFFNSVRVVGQVTVLVGVANLELDDLGDLIDVLKGTEDVSSLEKILLYNRKKFGAEFLLGWSMRDRSAGEFAKYLSTWQQGQNSPPRECDHLPNQPIERTSGAAAHRQ